MGKRQNGLTLKYTYSLVTFSLILTLNFYQLFRNKFVRTKMRPKEGTKIEMQRDLSDLSAFVRFCQILSDLLISSTGWTDRRTDGPTDGWTDPHIEMRGRI